MNVLRTPDECFGGLPGYPFEPRYVDVVADGLEPVRMHYLDEGPATDRSPCCCTASRPGPTSTGRWCRSSWPRGIRVVAPDNIGFGRSDKPTDPTDYTFARHIEWTRSLVTGLDLREITLVAQDWGGPIGLSVLAAEPDRFARVVAANTILHTADPALAGRLELGGARTSASRGW